MILEIITSVELNFTVVKTIIIVNIPAQESVH